MNRPGRSKALFKCRFGKEEGWGHLVRCSALAAAFRSRGWRTLLWSEGKLGQVPQDIVSSFDDVFGGPKCKAEVLVVDEMYTPQVELERLGSEWKLNNPNSLFVCVDDMKRRSLASVDVAINSELGLREANYEASFSLLGEEFALLRSEFSRDVSRNHGPLSNDRIPVFVMLGGTDAFGYLEKVLSLLASIDGCSFVPKTVVGTGELDESIFGRFEDYQLLRGSSAKQVANLMKSCRLGIIGCGGTAYEAAAVGLPFVGICLVDNQASLASQVERRWGMPVLNCEGGPTGLAGFEQAVRFALGKERGLYSKMDTFGGARIVEFLEVLLAKRGA